MPPHTVEMDGILHLPAFLATCLVVSATPGPATMYILGRTVAQGRQAGVASVLGTSTGGLVHTVFAATGLSAILATSAAAFTVVKLLGAAYLLFLGVQALIKKGDAASITLEKEVADARKAYRRGFLTQVLNPKIAVFMISFLPQFVDPHAGGPMPFLALGTIFVTLDTLWFLLLVATSARATQAFRRNTKAMTTLQKAAGLVYITLGIDLLRAKPTV